MALIDQLTSLPNQVTKPQAPSRVEKKKKFTLIQGIATPLGLVKPGSDASAQARVISTKRFIAIVATIISVNLLGILVINTKLDQDAFTLANLKSMRNVAMDQTDAIMNVVDRENSPAYIAATAKKLGMQPSTQINFLDINSPIVSNPVMASTPPPLTISIPANAPHIKIK